MDEPPLGQLRFVDYYADWCGPCKASAPVVEELEGEFWDLFYEFKRVNCGNGDEFYANKEEHDLLGVPTFAIEKYTREGWVEMARMVGFGGKKALRDWLIEQLSEHSE